MTGASRGIGEAIARRLAGEGALVIAAARSVEALEKVVAGIGETGGRAVPLPLDLSDSGSIQTGARSALEAHGRVDVLVNNAGVTEDGLILRMSREAWDRVLSTNLTGVFLLTQAIVKSMVRKRYGRIVNVTSIVGLTGNAGQANYAASKAALDAFSRSIASEIVDDRVAISTVYMPLVRTPMIQPTSHYKYFPALTPDEAAEMIIDAIVSRLKRKSTLGGRLSEVTYATAPRVQDAVVNAGYKLFPERSKQADDQGSAEQKAFARATKGVHW